MKKRILLICATHGDERIGLETVAVLERKGYADKFDYLIANPEALKMGMRFFECDLNRSYPGSEKSEIYKERRAYKILSVAKKYEYVIDMHEASSGINDFIIIPKKRLCKSFPIDLIGLETVLLWPEPKGPLGQFLENAIELEFGMKNRKREEVTTEAVSVVEKFIKDINKNDVKKSLSQKKIYRVYGKLMTDDFSGDISELKDFEEVDIDGEKFFPLLVGQYLENKIVCYKIKIAGS